MSRRVVATGAALLLAATGCAELAFVSSGPETRPSSRVALRAQLSSEPEHFGSVLEPLAAPEAAPEAEPAVGLGGILRTAAALLAAFVVALVPLDGAEAARSGGRMGGMGGGGMRMGGMGGGRMGGGVGMGARARPPPPRASPAPQAVPSSGPNVNIGVGPMFAPPIYGTTFFAPPPLFFPPPLITVPVPMGPSGNDRMLQEQQLRDERTIDSQKVQIEQMQKELADLKAKRQ